MALLHDATETASSVAWLMVLPALSTFLSFQKLTETAATRLGGSFRLPMPAALPDLWTFVSVPDTGISLTLGVPLAFAAVFFVQHTGLVAGYVGSIDNAVEDVRPAFVDTVTDYGVSVYGVQLVSFGLGLAAFSFALVGGMALAPLSAILSVVVGYLLWVAPILVVVRGYDAQDALAASATHALAGGRYATFAGLYLVCGLAASFLLSTLERRNPVAILLAAVVLAYPLLVVTIATVQVVQTLPEAEPSRAAKIRKRCPRQDTDNRTEQRRTGRPWFSRAPLPTVPLRGVRCGESYRWRSSGVRRRTRFGAGICTVPSPPSYSPGVQISGPRSPRSRR